MGEKAPVVMKAAQERPRQIGQLLGLVAMLLAVGAIGFIAMRSGPSGKQVAAGKLEVEGPATTLAVSVPAGARVDFSLYFEQLSYDGPNQLLLHAELLKGGAVVGTKDCAAYYIKTGFGTKNRTTKVRDQCAFRVPAGGIDALRVSGKREKTTPFAFQGLLLGVRVTPPEK